MKVTVIIPYNVSRGYLEEAIESVRSQTYDDVELIVEQGDCVWPISANKAIRKSSGDLIKILAEDDLLTPRSVEHAVEYFQANDVDFIHSDAINFRSDGTEFEHVPALHDYPNSPIPTFEYMLDWRNNPIHAITVTYSRSCFDKRMFNESLWTGEEWEFNTWLLKSGHKIGYLNKFTCRYRLHENQKSLGKNVDQISREDELDRITKSLM